MRNPTPAPIVIPVTGTPTMHRPQTLPRIHSPQIQPPRMHRPSLSAALRSSRR